MKAQSMDVIFDFLALQGFLTAADEVGFYTADETLSDEWGSQYTWGIVLLLLCCEVVNINTRTTALH
jgi:hypothetical protein